LCELPKKAMKWTFETFEVLPGLEDAYEAALELAARRGDKNWLLMTGGSDRGKTHLLMAICQRWLQVGIPARYAYVP
jgi:chromosomal replication initiation ATPase DnaA